MLSTETHRAAEVDAGPALFDRTVGIQPLGDQRNHRVRRTWIELGAVRPFQMRSIAGELDDSHLHPKTDTEVGNVVLPRETRGRDLALDTALTETAGDQNRVHTAQAFHTARLQLFRIDVMDIDVASRFYPGMHQGLVERLVRLGEVDVFADHGDIHLALHLVQAIDHCLPFAQISRRYVQAQMIDDDLIQILGMQHQRDPVDAVGVDRRDHGAFRDIGEQGNLAPFAIRYRAVGPAHQHVRLDADRAQFLDGMLGRLGLDLTSRRDIGHQGQVHEEDIFAPHLDAHLTDRLKERQGLDVADRASDLDQRYVRITGAAQDALLDFVGDMRNHLHCATQIIATSFLADDVVVDLPGGEIVVPPHGGADETFVVPQVEIRLRTIVGDKHLAVLKRTHGAGIHIDIGIQLDHRDLQATGFKQSTEGGRGNTFAEGRHNAARNKYAFSHAPEGSTEVETDGTKR